MLLPTMYPMHRSFAPTENPRLCGILPVNKAASVTSFHLVALLRRRTKIDKIGHAGTLDPFATGVMVMLIGKNYTRLSNQFLSADKRYRATLTLGQTTDTYDIDGKVQSESSLIPSLADVEKALLSFQGTCSQIPPMFSAKKIQGQKLCDLARKGISIERAPIEVQLSTHLISYVYPHLELDVSCSKGTYIRTLAYDLGSMLGCGAHLSSLCRTRSGSLLLSDCIDQQAILDPNFDLSPFLRKAP